MTTYKLHTGDCVKAMMAMPDESVDSIVTDPPYELDFMGRAWDRTGIAFNRFMWKEALRVLKPGGHILSFGGTRTYHRMVVAMEDAGFEIRDQLAWVYGSGFPKSLDVAKAIDKAAGVRKLAKAKIEEETEAQIAAYEPITEAAKEWMGWGTALKPAWEPIVLARKPLVGNVGINLQLYGAGALHIAQCRIGDDKKWPTNILHDGEAGMGVQGRFFYCAKASRKDRDHGLDDLPMRIAGGMKGREDGSMGSITEGKNHHSTVKPTDLMRWLCRLITPVGGTVLDPFMGSGSTGRGAVMEGFRFIGIEADDDFITVADLRIKAVAPKPVVRKLIIKRKTEQVPIKSAKKPILKIKKAAG